MDHSLHVEAKLSFLNWVNPDMVSVFEHFVMKIFPKAENRKLTFNIFNKDERQNVLFLTPKLKINEFEQNIFPMSVVFPCYTIYWQTVQEGENKISQYIFNSPYTRGENYWK